MSRPTGDADEIIRKALSQEEAEALGALHDPTTAQLLTETFRGRNRRLAILGAVLNLILFAGAIYGAVRFVRAVDVGDTLRWGAVTLACFGLVTAIKIWYWLEMARLSITRDVKRLEMQVARLAEAITDARRE